MGDQDENDPGHLSSSDQDLLLTTELGFVKQASINGLLPPGCSKPPTNLEELKMRFARARESPPPLEEYYKKYVEMVDEAFIAANCITNLLKFHNNKGYIQKFDVPFTGYPKNVGFNNG
ncbi:hypothetical protein SEPCBS57363_003930, partial [Sporothrix epigloea]